MCLSQKRFWSAYGSLPCRAGEKVRPSRVGTTWRPLLSYRGFICRQVISALFWPAVSAVLSASAVADAASLRGGP